MVHAQLALGSIIGICFATGYLMAYLARDAVFTSMDPTPPSAESAEKLPTQPMGKKWPGERMPEYMQACM